MKYTKEQKESIKKVADVFSEYLKSAKDMDLLYSEKFGYVVVSGINKNEDAFCMEPMIIKDGRELCLYLLQELGHNFIELTPHTCHDLFEVSDKEQEMIKEIFRHYINELPEYVDLIEIPFLNPIEEELVSFPTI